MHANFTSHSIAGVAFFSTHLMSECQHAYHMLITLCIHRLQQRLQQLSSRMYVMSTSDTQFFTPLPPAELTLPTYDAVGTCKDS